MKKLKIIHTVYGDASGGRWQAMLNTFDALASKGHEGVLVYGEENKNLKSENYPKFCLNSSGFYDLLAAVKLALWLRTYRPDVVIAHSGRAVYLFKNAIFFARIKCPVIAMNHSHNVKRMLRADGFIHITPYVGQCVAVAAKKKSIDLTKKPQAIISNLIHLPESQPSFSEMLSEPVVLGIMTRLVEYKGTHLAISAVQQLKQRGYKVKLLIAGDGEQKATLIQQVKDLSLENEVKFLGWIGGEDKRKFYDDIDIALVPTMNDTQPLAILDAFAWGKPVVASDHISVQQIIRQGENGLMAKCGDITDLVDNLAFFIEHPEQICKIARSGYQDAENEYQFCRVADKLNNFLYFVLN
ncbi:MULTISPECIES: glycosyltransferase family 4 protein [unclassified Acinetobacter]|uniref:glycosyltransferase family 4 protein n=1 Tax=unclassified Acinetobacter TaxID=196816 RepID=UPI0015D3C354|nr:MULTISPECIES: glycosyltransferase family 4 protein [unclassified Acinetobacter]